MTTSHRSLLVLVVSVLLLAGYNFLGAAWTPAVGVPPVNNTDAPVNIGATTQAKAGNLSVNILAATSQIRANAYCNAVGTACPLQVMPSGFVAIASVAPTIHMQDTDHSDFFMHVNSNIWYLLADRNGDGTWTAELPGPLTIGAGPTPASDYVRTQQFRANQYCDANGQNCFVPTDVGSTPPPVPVPTCTLQTTTVSGVCSGTAPVPTCPAGYVETAPVNLVHCDDDRNRSVKTCGRVVCS